MRRSLAIMIFTATTLAAGAALAQTPGGGGGGVPPGSYQQQTGGAVGRLTEGEQSWRFESEEQRRARLPSPEELEAEYGAERMDLARRVSALIEQGKCREARDLASEAGERSMVIRIRQTCRQRG
jgi:hypothetical protein